MTKFGTLRKYNTNGFYNRIGWDNIDDHENHM